ncbi:MAG: spore germination protein [Acidobacteriota bacterium]|nr:spore germination protein [Acidobacteriota bacterium]
MSSIRDQIIKAAIAETTPPPYGKVSDRMLDSDGNRAGWRDLKAYFDEAVSGWSEMHWKARGKIKPEGQNEWKTITYLEGVQKPNHRVPQPVYDTLGRLVKAVTGEQQYKESGVSWCGIFATWVLRRTGLGVWWMPGIVGNQVQKVSGNVGFQPGDVLVFHGKQVHHAVFISENSKAYGGDGSLDTINGNSNYQSIERHSRYFPHQVWYYYKILG